MEMFYIVALLTTVCAEPPVPEGFAGYERGGYEIQTRDGQKTFPGADQLNFPGVSAVGVGGGQSLELQDEFPSGQRDGLGAGGEQQRGRGRFEGGSKGEEEGSLDDIPGVAGKDYPIYGNVPTTSFSCDQQTAPGYFADVDTQCQVFHICQKGGQKNSVLCPNGTIFNQKVFVCSWWYDFDCDSAPGLFSLNEKNSEEADAATSRGRQGGYSDNRGNSIASDDSQNFDQDTRELSETAGQNTFEGYQENRQRPEKLSNARNEQNGGVSESQNRGNKNADLEGYSKNGPNTAYQELNRNDLTTSGRFSERIGGDTSSSGYPSGTVEQVNGVGAGYPGGRNENTRDRNGNGNSQGRGSRYEGPSGNAGQQLRDQSAENVGQNGYPSGGRSGVSNNDNRDGQEQSSQYLPPGVGAIVPGGYNNEEATIATDRSYLPPS